MKILFKLFLFTLITIILGICSCGSDDDGESTTAKTERLLQSAWQLDKLTVDDTNQTALFPGLEITVAAGTYTSQNGEPVWPASGTWSLTDATTILRDDDITITIQSISETNLVIVFHWEDTTYGKGGRTSSVAGDHTFEFITK